MTLTDVSTTWAEVIFTWLWRWLPLRLSKRQSMSSQTVLLRTTLTRTIVLYFMIWLLGSNHLQLIIMLLITKRLADVKVILNYKLLNNPKVVWKNELKAKQFVMWTKEFLVRALLIINETPEVALIKIEAKAPVWRQCSWFSVVLPITRPTSRYATWPQLRNSLTSRFAPN